MCSRERTFLSHAPTLAQISLKVGVDKRVLAWARMLSLESSGRIPTAWVVSSATTQTTMTAWTVGWAHTFLTALFVECFCWGSGKVCWWEKGGNARYTKGCTRGSFSLVNGVKCERCHFDGGKSGGGNARRLFRKVTHKYSQIKNIHTDKQRSFSGSSYWTSCVSVPAPRNLVLSVLFRRRTTILRSGGHPERERSSSVRVSLLKSGWADGGAISVTPGARVHTHSHILTVGGKSGDPSLCTRIREVNGKRWVPLGRGLGFSESEKKNTKKEKQPPQMEWIIDFVIKVNSCSLCARNCYNLFHWRWSFVI